MLASKTAQRRSTRLLHVPCIARPEERRETGRTATTAAKHSGFPSKEDDKKRGEENGRKRSVKKNRILPPLSTTCHLSFIPDVSPVINRPNSVWESTNAVVAETSRNERIKPAT